MRYLALLSLAATITLSGADRVQSRSRVFSQNGIVSTSHVLASQAGARILARGGSAADAAIAANAVLGVVEPMMCGVGGDLFVLYWEATTGKLHGLNASGWAPRELTPGFLAKAGAKTMPASGIHAVTVPGAVDGWAKAHARFGKLPWKDLFGEAINFAQNGHPVHEIIHSYWNDSRLKVSEEAQRVFLPGGRAPEAGEMFSNPDLAWTLKMLAGEGRDSFYTGAVAQRILDASKKLGGTMTAADLAEFSSEWVEPVFTTYKGWTVYELPPNGQGMAALIMLNLMEQAGADMHTQIEAMKLSYADLLTYNADPKFAPVPVQGLLSKGYAQQRAKLIDANKAHCAAPAGHPVMGDTTYLTVVDREGNIASWIQSVSAGWGSGVVAEGTGFVLQNRGGHFVIDSGHPNQLAARKRPFHTIIPAFAEKGDLRVGFGIMGGPNQPLAHAQFMSNLADHDMNIQLALDSPRFTKNGPAGCDVQVEDRVGPEAIAELKRRGHVVQVRGAYSTNMGRGAAVQFNTKTGIKEGACDPRSDGIAAPE